MNPVVGNRDRCGRCGTRHGGNNHYCPVHGAVSADCCEPVCSNDDWELVVYQWVPTPGGRHLGEWQPIERYSPDEYQTLPFSKLHVGMQYWARRERKPVSAE